MNISIRELKKAARRTVRTHFGLFLLLAVLLVFSGAESAIIREIFRQSPVSTEAITGVKRSFSAADLPAQLLSGQASWIDKLLGVNDSTSIATTAGTLGQTSVRAALSTVMTALGSGELVTRFLSALYSFVRADSMLIRVLIPFAFLSYALIWFFLINILPGAVNRMVLEARLYRHVPMQRLLFFRDVRCWKKAAGSLAWVRIRQFLWNLTVIGGIIAHYRYLMVPYIVAENPDISSGDAVALSLTLMKGHKREAFALELSFLGWDALGILTFGLVTFLWTRPYRRATMAESTPFPP